MKNLANLVDKSWAYATTLNLALQSVEKSSWKLKKSSTLKKVNKTKFFIINCEINCQNLFKFFYIPDLRNESVEKLLYALLGKFQEKFESKFTMIKKDCLAKSLQKL